MLSTHNVKNAPIIMRCAVYTRVSVDRDPNDRFGSTNAQFMACHEFIASQLSKGWRPVDRLYEDRGFSQSSEYRGCRYAYYIPQKEIAVSAGASGLPRFRAHELHQRIWDYLRQHFRDPAPWFDDLPETLTTHPSFDRELIAARLAKLDHVFDLLWPVHQKRIFRQLVDRVTVGPDHFVVRVTVDGLIDLIF